MDISGLKTDHVTAKSLLLTDLRPLATRAHKLNGLRPSLQAAHVRNGYLYLTDTFGAVRLHLKHLTDLDPRTIAALGGKTLPIEVIKSMYGRRRTDVFRFDFYEGGPVTFIDWAGRAVVLEDSESNAPGVLDTLENLFARTPSAPGEFVGVDTEVLAAVQKALTPIGTKHGRIKIEPAPTYGSEPHLVSVADTHKLDAYGLVMPCKFD